MLGAFCTVSFNRFLNISKVTIDPEKMTAWGTPLEIKTPMIEAWLGDFGAVLIDYSVPVSIVAAIPVMLLFGLAMERGLIRFFYKRPHADQILGVPTSKAMVMEKRSLTGFRAAYIRPQLWSVME